MDTLQLEELIETIKDKGNDRPKALPLCYTIHQCENCPYIDCEERCDKFNLLNFTDNIYDSELQINISSDLVQWRKEQREESKKSS